MSDKPDQRRVARVGMAENTRSSSFSDLDALLGGSSGFKEAAFLQSRIERLQTELQAQKDLVAQSEQRIRELEEQLAEQSVAADQSLLADKHEQTLRDLESYRAAKRSNELMLLDVRASWKEAEARVANVRASAQYRLGALLMASFASWREFAGLPSALLQWRREEQAAREEAATQLIPSGVAPEYTQASATAAERADKNGVEAAERWIQDQRFRAPVLARVLLDLAKHVRFTDAAAAVRLAKAAVEADPNEGRVKHLAFILMDVGSITEAYEVLHAAIAGGAALNATELRRKDELFAFKRLQTNRAKLPARSWRARRRSGRKALLFAQQSLPFHWSAAALRVEGLAQALRSAGFSVEIATVPGYPPAKPTAEKPKAARATNDIVDGIPHHRLPEMPVSAAMLDDYARQTGVALGRIARAIEASVIVAPSSFQLAHPAMIAARVSGATAWLDGQSLPSSEAASSERDRLKLDLEIETLGQADCVLARSAVLGRAFESAGIAADRIVTIGEPLPAFARDTKIADWRADPALAGRVTIGYIGDPYEDLDLESLPDILDRLVARGLDVALLVFGVGTRFQKIKERVDILGHGGRALFPGRPRFGAIGAAFETLDVFLAPQRQGAPTSLRARYELAEALANGRPIVVTRSPSVEEALKEDAVLADSTFDDFVEAAARVAGDADLRGEMQQRARAHASGDTQSREAALTQLAERLTAKTG